MSRYGQIEDPRRRAQATLNHALRGGSTDDALTQEVLAHGVHLVDFDRDVVASHLMQQLEAEFGPVFPWSENR